MNYKTTSFMLNIYLVKLYTLSNYLQFFAISVRKSGHNCLYFLADIGYRSIRRREGVRKR
jgi:hypothetical protein